MLKIIFASSFFLIALLLIFLFFNDSNENGVAFYNLKVQASACWLIYGIAIASSFAMLYFPVAKYDLNLSWAFFSSLNLSEIIRVTLGYFMLTVFPGYAACRAFAQNKLSNGFEKLTLVLALSYIITVVLGLSLSSTAGLTLINYLITLWAFALACEALSYAFKQKSVIRIPQYTRTSLIKTGLIIAVCLLLVFSSYLITLSANPTSYALGGDVANYVSVSNALLKGYPFTAPYVWFQMFIGLASVLTGVQPIYAFVGMQFLIILFPLSFYTLLRSLFKDDKLATVGTVVTTITGGLSSLGILGLFTACTKGNVFSALWTLRTKTQNWPWLSNNFFLVATMDWSLLMLGFAFLYSFIVGNRSSRLSNLFNLIIGSVFIASTFYTHSVLSIMIFSITILVFSLLDYKYMKRTALAFMCIILATIVFDLLSYNLLTNTLINYYLTYRVFFASSSMFPYQWGIIVFLILALSVLLIPKLIQIVRKKIAFVENDRRFSIRFISLVCGVMAVIIFVVSLALVAIHFNALNTSEEIIFPWYIYAVIFAPLLQLAILSVPIMLRAKKETRLAYWLMLSWGVAAILVIGLNVFFPLFVTPLLVNRVLMSVYLPLGALSALTLVSLNLIDLQKISFGFVGKHAQGHIKKIAGFLLVVLLGFSFLSFAYSTELFYQGNLQGSMPSAQKNLYMYLESLPPEKTFLTYSYSSYTSISSLTTHKTYAYYQYGTFVTWPIQILFDTSSPEVAYYFLYKLGITDIVLTEQDLATLLETSNGTLASMLNFLPIVFNNTFATVYSVPSYLLSESSNYVLIEPTVGINSDSLYNLAYNALTSNEVPFTTVEDTNFLNLTSNNVYISSDFSTNGISSNDLIASVKTGAHAIFLYDSLPSVEGNQELLQSLGVESTGNISANSAHLAEENISFPADMNIANLTIRNSRYLNNVISYYTTLENESVPLIINFAVGNGSIVLINLPPPLNLDRALANIAINAIETVVAVLPGFIHSNTLETLSYPEDLFALGSPDLINIYNLKGLTNYIYAFSDIKLEGNISMSSDYVIFNGTNLPIKTLVLQNATNQELLENVSVANLCLVGSYNTTLTAQGATICLSGDELPSIQTSLNSLKIYVNTSAVNLTIQQNGQEKSLVVSNGSIEFEFAGNFTTNLILQEPVIMLNQGSLNTSWEGVFWYNGKMFTTVSLPENWVINGNLSFQVIQSNNVILIKLFNKDNISVIT